MPEHDDNIEGFNAAAYEEQNRHSKLKFPRVPVLDEDGNPTGATISPSEYDESSHKDKIGCPCCLAKLLAAGSKDEEGGQYKIQGTFDGQRHFRSKSLKDHKDECPFGHEDVGVRTRAFKMLEFLNTDGKKRLNWNFMNGDRQPRYAEEHQDVALKRHDETHAQMRKRLAMVEAIQPKSYEATYSVKTAREAASMIAMIRTMDDPESVYESIDVISQSKALPLSEMVAGEDWEGLARLTQMREKLGLSMSAVVTADTENAHVVENFAGYTFVIPEQIRIGMDADGNVQGYRLLIATTDEKAAEALLRGDKVAMQGYSALDVSFANRPEFQKEIGVNQDGRHDKLIMVHIRKGDHVSAISANFETKMEDEPVYSASYERAMRPEDEAPEYDPDDPSTWDRNDYDDYDA